MPGQHGNPGPEACTNWRDWFDQPEKHNPFQYWAWDDADRASSERRLGERIYICSCLLWSALHDRRLGLRISGTHPNWSAVCAYYSMVHAARLLWFLSYGSYPKRHAELAASLAGSDRGVVPDWCIGEFPRGRTPICTVALQGFIAGALELRAQAERLPAIGNLLASALSLRNDSNYESLVLAHQYRHLARPVRSSSEGQGHPAGSRASGFGEQSDPGDRSGPYRPMTINVEEGFRRATGLMNESAGHVSEICRRSPFGGIRRAELDRS